MPDGITSGWKKSPRVRSALPCHSDFSHSGQSTIKCDACTTHRLVDVRHSLGVAISVTARLHCGSRVDFTATFDATCEQATSRQIKRLRLFHEPSGSVPKVSRAARTSPNSCHRSRQIHRKHKSLKLGQALWGTTRGAGAYRVYFADPHAGKVGIEGAMRENGTSAVPLLCLKVVNRKITEVEAPVHRNADDVEALEKLGQPNPVCNTSPSILHRLGNLEKVGVQRCATRQIDEGLDIIGAAIRCRYATQDYDVLKYMVQGRGQIWRRRCVFIVRNDPS